MTIIKSRQESNLVAAYDAMANIVATAEREERDITPSEEIRFNELLKEFGSIDQKLQMSVSWNRRQRS